MLDAIKKLLNKKSNDKYNFDSFESIQNISIPKYKLLQGMGSPVNNIEYILQKKQQNIRKMEEWI